MPELRLPGVTIAYDLFGPDEGDPVVLVCGLSQPAIAWQISLVPALTAAGYRVVTFDNRGVAPSSSPEAPYTVEEMVADTVGLLDHLGLGPVLIAGYSMGGWIAETLAAAHPGRVRAAVFIGSCNVGTSWEKVITTVERDLARLEPEMPAWFQAAETLRYLPNHELQRDEVVDEWMALLDGAGPWENPGRLGQYEAALAWSLDVERTKRWPSLVAPCLVLSFEHDVDSPPARARQASEQIPGARFVEVAGASHLGVFTHADEVATEILGFFSGLRDEWANERMSEIMPSEPVQLAGRPVRRMGFGAMQLPGPGVFGPPADRHAALAVLRRAVDGGVNHIDTAQFYGPDVANGLIREALSPYPDELVLVSKVGARRDGEGHWLPAQTPEELRAGVEENLRSLGVDRVAVVNLRRIPDSGVSFADQLAAMAALHAEGVVGGIGLSNVTLEDYVTARSEITVACVQNAYNVTGRSDQALFEACRDDAVPYVPFFPLGSAFFPDNPVLTNPAVQETARRLTATTAQVALAWLLAQAPTVLLIPGTSSLSHLEENLAAGDLVLDDEALAALGAAAD